MPRNGTSVFDFFARFPDELACLQYIFETRWGDHSPCPRCGRLGHWFHLKGTKKYQHACHCQVSVLEGTIFYRSNISLMAWFYAMLLAGNSSIGVRGTHIRKQLGLGTKSTVRLSNLIRLQMAAYDRQAMLGGPGQTVYVDEALIRYGKEVGLGGAATGHIVMGFATDEHILTGIVPDRRASTIISHVERIIRPGTRIITDGHASYKSLGKRSWRHVVVNHSVAFHDFAGNNTSRIETYWRVLKRTLAAYRRVHSQYLWLYIAEAEFRYNFRNSDISAFEHLISRFPVVWGENLDRIGRRFDWRPSQSFQAYNWCE